MGEEAMKDYTPIPLLKGNDDDAVVNLGMSNRHCIAHIFLNAITSPVKGRFRCFITS